MKLSPIQATTFHNILAKALYLVKRARPDALLTIAFLSTQVREPDVEDWSKLEHLVRYFRSTIDLLLILGADGTGPNRCKAPRSRDLEILLWVLFQKRRSPRY
jgi:hypothetical protein